MKRISIFLALAASALHAAIITERNDVFSSFPESAVFRGTSAAPGIESQWIPYGTYTGGNGGTEYLRVTSNLVGVVASVFDGYWERVGVVNGATNIWDYGSGELWTNDTLRILDYINSSRRLGMSGNLKQIYTNVIHVTIEEHLCSESGTLDFGSRVLDALAVNVDPPISTSWFAAIPFSAADAEAWVSVWPSYNILTNDTHFLTYPFRRPWRGLVAGFLYLGNFAGQDYSNAYDDLLDALDDKFVPVTIPEVLAYDTGLKYPGGSPTNDYWTVNGYRLSLHEDREEAGWVQKWWWSDDLFEDEYGEYELDICYDTSYSSPWEFYKYYPWGGRSRMLWSGADEEDLDVISGYDYETGESFDGYRTTMYDETDDFAHWRNMTTRLDWKRLGIICQLERQMETTYYPRGSDDLPLVAEYAEVGNTYTGTLHVAYTIAQSPDPDTGAYPITWQGSLSDVNWQREGSSRDVTTNFQGMSFPVAAAGQPLLSAGIANTYVTLGYFDLPFDDMENDCLNYFTTTPAGVGDGSYSCRFEGAFEISGTRATLDIVSGYVWIGDTLYEEHHDSHIATWTMENGEADFNLRLGESKTASATYTLSDAQTVRSNLVESITRNDLFFWDNGWIAERTLPTFEAMISATNCQDLVDVQFDEGPVPMGWDDLAPSNGPQRVFRMSPEPTTAESRVALMNNRVAILLGLDREVKTRFASLAGQSVTSIASASANLTPSESAELRAEIDVKHPAMYLTADAFMEYDISSRIPVYIDGTIKVVSGSFVAVHVDDAYYWSAVPKVNDAFRFGNWGLRIDSAGAGMSATNCPPVRVDGHQSQVLKTLWRFKNLRDPNL